MTHTIIVMYSVNKHLVLSYHGLHGVEFQNSASTVIWVYSFLKISWVINQFTYQSSTTYIRKNISYRPFFVTLKRKIVQFLEWKTIFLAIIVTKPDILIIIHALFSTFLRQVKGENASVRYSVIQKYSLRSLMLFVRIVARGYRHPSNNQVFW